jgi:hypothetical protein
VAASVEWTRLATVAGMQDAPPENWGRVVPHANFENKACNYIWIVGLSTREEGRVRRTGEL